MVCFIKYLFWSFLAKYFFNSTYTRFDLYASIYGTHSGWELDHNLRPWPIIIQYNQITIYSFQYRLVPSTFWLNFKFRFLILRHFMIYLDPGHQRSSWNVGRRDRENGSDGLGTLGVLGVPNSHNLVGHSNKLAGVVIHKISFGEFVAFL